MIRALLAVTLATWSALAPAQPATRFATEEVDRWIERLRDARGFSGAVVIERDGAVVYSRGVGLANPDTRRAFTPDTRTDGASLAKPFTATLLLMLAAEGRIDLEAAVQRYVPEYPDATTTVRQLLSHDASLPDYGAFDALFRKGLPVTTQAMLAEVQRGNVPAPAAVASRFAYCNLCLDTAALVIERVGGQSFEQQLRERVFGPLDIGRAFIRPARLADLPTDRAVGYRISNARHERYDAEDLEGFHGGSNLYASARDFARFARAFATGSAVPGAAVTRSALSPARLASDVATGLTLGGWYCAADGQRCYYTGDHRGFYNVMYWDRAQRLVVVYVSNSTLAAWVRPRIARGLVAAAEGRSVSPLVEPTLVPLTPESLRGATGSYDVEGVGRVTLFVDQDEPHARVAGGVEYRLHRVSRTLMYAPGLDAFVGVARDGRLSWTSVFVETLVARAASR